jgi:hypothetical protein
LRPVTHLGVTSYWATNQWSVCLPRSDIPKFFLPDLQVLV